MENLGLPGEEGGFHHLDAYARRRREYGSNLQLIRPAVADHASWVAFQVEELKAQCTRTTMLRLNRNVPDLHELSIVDIRTGDWHYRHLIHSEANF